MENDTTTIDNVNDPRWRKYIMDDTREFRQPKVGDFLRSWADRLQVIEVGDQMVHFEAEEDKYELCDRAVRVRVVEVYSPEDSEVHQDGDSLIFLLGDLLAPEGDSAAGYTYDDPPSYDSAEGDSEVLAPMFGVTPPPGVVFGQTTAAELAERNRRMHPRDDDLAAEKSWDFSKPIPLGDPPKTIEVDQVISFIEALQEQANRESKGDAHEYLDRLYVMINTISN